MAAARQNGILCLGSLMVDVVCPVSALPASGEGVVAEGYSMMLGGCAFNTANIVRQLGGTCRLFAPVGQGPYADFVRSELVQRNMFAIDVDTTLDSGVAICLVEPDGERTMITLPGIERCYSRSWCHGIDFSRFAYAEVCGYEIDGVGGDEIIAILEEHPGLCVYFAPGPPTARMAREKIDRINALHPIWHLNEMEACAYTGCEGVVEAGLRIAQECGNTVVITAGPHGAHIFDGGVHSLVPTCPVAVVDSIGAGDAHIGAIMAMRQKGASWEQSVAFANQVSAVVCGVRGATLSDDAFCSAFGTARLMPDAVTESAVFQTTPSPRPSSC